MSTRAITNLLGIPLPNVYSDKARQILRHIHFEPATRMLQSLTIYLVAGALARVIIPLLFRSDQSSGNGMPAKRNKFRYKKVIRDPYIRLYHHYEIYNDVPRFKFFLYQPSEFIKKYKSVPMQSISNTNNETLPNVPRFVVLLPPLVSNGKSTEIPALQEIDQYLEDEEITSFDHPLIAETEKKLKPGFEERILRKLKERLAQEQQPQKRP